MFEGEGEVARCGLTVLLETVTGGIGNETATFLPYTLIPVSVSRRV